MGPLAGVVLQQRITEATLASCDQDHYQMVCFSNPKIPDRNKAILSGRKDEIVTALRSSIAILEDAGVSVIAIPCNTVHAYLSDLQETTAVPILDMVRLVNTAIQQQYSSKIHIGLLATDGTIHSSIYNQFDNEWVLPSSGEQKEVMNIIYDIKSGNTNTIVARIQRIIDLLRSRGVDVIVLGCTELSLYANQVEGFGVSIVDPMQLLAYRLVSLGSSSTV